MRFTDYFSHSDVRIANTLACAGIGATRLAAIGLGFLAVMAGPAQAQGAIRVSAPPVEYVPFEVVVQTTNSYCFDPTFPLLGEVQYSKGGLSVVLTHLSSPLLRIETPSTCGRERRFTVPGLPRGGQTIKVDITDRGDGAGAHVSETIMANFDVAPFSATASLVNFWTGRIRPAQGNGPWAFVLTASRFAPFYGQWSWLEVGDPETSYTFKAFALDTADRLPEALARLFYVAYPTPFGGAFMTVDRAVAQRLGAEWNNPVTELPFAVGRLNQGACPVGMSPVYQTFHPQAVSHRWTQSRAAYAQLLTNGYAGEGPAWCAPALRGE